MKLNLGCGYNTKDGFVNVDVDHHKGVDVLWDLNTTPWPWEDDSIDEIFMSHILEHLGSDTETYYMIWKELYRVCKNGTELHIIVPHPRHDHFIGDPSHVRAITQDGLDLLSKKNCDKFKEMKAANSPLAHYLSVDFEMTKSQVQLSEHWNEQVKKHECDQEQLNFAVKHFNNVVQSSYFVLKVIK